MKLYKKILVCLLLPLVVLFAKPVIAEPIEIQNPIVITDEYIQEQIEYFSQINGVDPNLISKIIKCESKNNHNAVGDGGRAFGVMQYHKASFENHAKLYGEVLDYYSTYDQIKLGVWAIANGRGNEWTAYRAIKNGGTYSFYSNLLKKHYTITCR